MIGLSICMLWLTLFTSSIVMKGVYNNSTIGSKGERMKYICKNNKFILYDKKTYQNKKIQWKDILFH